MMLRDLTSDIANLNGSAIQAQIGDYFYVRYNAPIFLYYNVSSSTIYTTAHNVWSGSEAYETNGASPYNIGPYNIGPYDTNTSGATLYLPISDNNALSTMAHPDSSFYKNTTVNVLMSNSTVLNISNSLLSNSTVLKLTYKSVSQNTTNISDFVDWSNSTGIFGLSYSFANTNTSQSITLTGTNSGTKINITDDNNVTNSYFLSSDITIGSNSTSSSLPVSLTGTFTYGKNYPVTITTVSSTTDIVCLTQKLNYIPEITPTPLVFQYDIIATSGGTTTAPISVSQAPRQIFTTFTSNPSVPLNNTGVSASNVGTDVSLNYPTGITLVNGSLPPPAVSSSLSGSKPSLSFTPSGLTFTGGYFSTQVSDIPITTSGSTWTSYIQITSGSEIKTASISNTTTSTIVTVNSNVYKITYVDGTLSNGKISATVSTTGFSNVIFANHQFLNNVDSTSSTSSGLPCFSKTTLDLLNIQKPHYVVMSERKNTKMYSCEYRGKTYEFTYNHHFVYKNKLYTFKDLLKIHPEMKNIKELPTSEPSVVYNIIGHKEYLHENNIFPISDDLQMVGGQAEIILKIGKYEYSYDTDEKMKKRISLIKKLYDNPEYKKMIEEKYLNMN